MRGLLETTEVEIPGRPTPQDKLTQVTCVHESKLFTSTKTQRAASLINLKASLDGSFFTFWNCAAKSVHDNGSVFVLRTLTQLMDSETNPPWLCFIPIYFRRSGNCRWDSLYMWVIRCTFLIRAEEMIWCHSQTGVFTMVHYIWICMKMEFHCWLNCTFPFGPPQLQILILLTFVNIGFYFGKQ